MYEMSEKMEVSEKQPQNLENELETAFVIAYDLPSENRSFFENGKKKTEFFYKIRNTRVSAITKLHKLGILTTESVILVPKSNEKVIKQAIDHVMKMYEDLNKELSQNGIPTIGMPLIKVIPLNSRQTEDFKEIAQRKISKKLDEVLERLNDVLENLDDVVDEVARRKIKYNMNKQRKELERIQRICEELGIDLSGKFDLVFDFFKEINEKVS